MKAAVLVPKVKRPGAQSVLWARMQQAVTEADELSRKSAGRFGDEKKDWKLVGADMYEKMGCPSWSTVMSAVEFGAYRRTTLEVLFALAETVEPGYVAINIGKDFLKKNGVPTWSQVIKEAKRLLRMCEDGGCRYDRTAALLLAFRWAVDVNNGEADE